VIILESGNIFKDVNKQPLTQRINQADVDPTIKWLEGVLEIPLLNGKLGSTGRKATSGDLDIAIDASKYAKTDIILSLTDWMAENVPKAKPKEYIVQSGISVHFKTPINGNPANGFVQTDLMFGDPNFMRWSVISEPESELKDQPEYKGVHRQILISSIATVKGYKFGAFNGLTNRETNEFTTDPAKIANIILGPNHSQDELTSIPKILNAIANDPEYDNLVQAATETFPKYGVSFPPRPNGSGPLQEAKEGPRIQHAEDIILWEGSSGAIRSLELLAKLSSKQGQSATTIKWDGSPAVIFGRDQNGEFIFTDKNGFVVKSYDGKAKSPQQLKDMFVKSRRTDKGMEVTPDYLQFAESMANAFSIFEKAVPRNHKGYFFGDLLYLNKPPIVEGKYEFKPNIVTYRTEPNSDIGKKISRSNVGVVVHYEIDFENNHNAVKNFNIFTGEELLVVKPITIQNPIEIDEKGINTLKSLILSNASKIDSLLDETKLRSIKLTGLPEVFYTYLNSKVDTGLENLGVDFFEWMESKEKINTTMKDNIKKYISENNDAFIVLWKIIEGTIAVKNNIVSQLDLQDAPVKAFIGKTMGGEGYVIADPSGDIKLVDRLGFTKANRAVQREGMHKTRILKENTTGNTIALFPGSFKPPHKGHMDVVSKLSNQFGKVIVIVSAPIKQLRSRITAEQAVQIFNLYIADAGLSDKAIAITSPIPTPVGTAYKFIQEEDFAANTKVFVATSTKDQSRYPQEKLDKAAAKNPTNPTATEITLDTSNLEGGEPVSATLMRQVIDSGKENSHLLRKFFPDKITTETIAKIISILFDENTSSAFLNEILEIIREVEESMSMSAGSVEGAVMGDDKIEKKKYGMKEIIDLVNKQLEVEV